jgi:hypothetical protein
LGEEAWWDESVVIYAYCVDLGLSIGVVIFSFSPRKTSQVAHELARFCFDNESSCNWASEAPSFLLSMFVNDVICVGN